MLLQFTSRHNFPAPGCPIHISHHNSVKSSCKLRKSAIIFKYPQTCGGYMSYRTCFTSGFTLLHETSTWTTRATGTELSLFPQFSNSAWSNRWKGATRFEHPVGQRLKWKNPHLLLNTKLSSWDKNVRNSLWLFLDLLRTCSCIF
jgi:hypothetical protein